MQEQLDILITEEKIINWLYNECEWTDRWDETSLDNCMLFYYLLDKKVFDENIKVVITARRIIIDKHEYKLPKFMEDVYTYFSNVISFTPCVVTRDEMLKFFTVLKFLQ